MTCPNDSNYTHNHYMWNVKFIDSFHLICVLCIAFGRTWKYFFSKYFFRGYVHFSSSSYSFWIPLTACYCSIFTLRAFRVLLHDVRLLCHPLNKHTRSMICIHPNYSRLYSMLYQLIPQALLQINGLFQRP